MTRYFVPEPMPVKLPVSGRTLRLWRGIHDDLPDELVDHDLANTLGIIPEGEMTDADYRSCGLKRPEPAPKAEAEDVREAEAEPIALPAPAKD